MATEDCPRDCPMAQKIIMLEETEKRHGETHKEIFGRLNKLETENAVQNARYDAIMEKLERMDTKNDRMAEKMESLERTAAKQAQAIDELNERGKSNQARLKELESKPGENWKTMVGAIISAVVGVIVGVIAAGIIPG